MKTYLTLIKFTQRILLGVSILILAFLPEFMVFYPHYFTQSVTDNLYSAAHASLFFVMTIRPLADVLRRATFIRPLVILRKGAGVFSASIAVSFLLAKFIIDPSGYLASYSTHAYWSVSHLTLFAHLADVAAILLLITSNNLSKRLLGTNWKRIQRLSYVYFYGSALYVIVNYGNSTMVAYTLIVTTLTITAFFVNRRRRLIVARISV